MRKLASMVLLCGALAYADNFILDTASEGSGNDKHGMGDAKHGSSHGVEAPPQKVVISGIDPSSDLGKAISQYVKQNNKPKPVVKKKKKKPAASKPQEGEAANFGKIIDEHKNGDANMHAKEVPAPSEHDQKAAEHNTNKKDAAPAPSAGEEHGAAPAKAEPKHDAKPDNGHSDIKDLLKPIQACG